MSAPEGVVAIVGGSRGTGAELARGILEDGGLVVVGYADKDTKARQVAGLLDTVRRPFAELDPPTYGDRAIAVQADLTDSKSAYLFADNAAAFARQHNTTVDTLVLAGSVGIGKTVRETFAVNQEGLVRTADIFWRETEDAAGRIALTVFTQSFQGHTAFLPFEEYRSEFPDDYAQVAISKWNGEVGLRLLNNRQNEGRHPRARVHLLGVAVGDALIDSDPIMLLKRRAAQAKDRVDAGDAKEGDEAMVEQMAKLDEHNDELAKAGFKSVTTEAYAQLVRELIDDIDVLSDEGEQVTRYLPEKSVVDGKIVDLKALGGNPRTWTTFEYE